MRNMSFFITNEQIQNRTKTVTRRLGWKFLKSFGGERIQACEKCQGLKKGEKINKLSVIETVSSRWEVLDSITKEDVAKEGFLNMSTEEFILMFCKFNKCNRIQPVNRIEFKYVER